MDARLRSMTRIPSLDGLRAISISLVVVGHWTELRYHSVVAGAFANLGVKIFFVISGYLITSLLLKEYERSSTIHCVSFTHGERIGFFRPRSFSCCRCLLFTGTNYAGTTWQLRLCIWRILIFCIRGFWDTCGRSAWRSNFIFCGRGC